jgi:pimeloyl-ACP methyl ester carboxylesterase
VLGGPWYLSTTAEILASRGYLVAAPVRFTDISEPVPTLDYRWSVERSTRDAEWILAELARDPAADTARVAALGHGGGGMQALVLAMRNPAIRSVVNIDAGNFSKRTNPGQLAFYHPRLLRVPYLNILTAATRQDLDLYSDFESMRFSRRHEVILPDPALRHHDLSDVGRGVSAVLGIRGEPQQMVLRAYADVQQAIVRFLGGDTTIGAVRPAVDPAPTTVEVLDSLSDATPQSLRDAHRRDPEAPVFGEDDLRRILEAARGRPTLAAGLASFALELHPKSYVLYRTAAESANSADLYRRCAALDPPQNDWRAGIAFNACRERAAR